MRTRIRCTLTVLVCALGWLAAPVAAESVTQYPDMPGLLAGEVDFTGIKESSTNDLTPLFGTPQRIANDLLFMPTAFASSSLNGAPDITDGKLQLMITADQGYFLEVIQFIEYGDYLLTGAGGAGTQANVGGSLTITDMTPGNFPTIIQAPLNVQPTPPYTLPDPGGMFQAFTQVDLMGYEWTKVFVVFTDNLSTSSQVGTTAFIEKNMIHGPMRVRVIPEPACLGLLGAGAGLLLRRRRR